MAATYELWDMESRNIIGAHAMEADALRSIAHAVHTYGPDYAHSLALIREDSRGRSRLIAQGADLMQRALAAAANESPTSPPRRTASA